MTSCMSQGLDYTWSDWTHVEIEMLGRMLKGLDDIVGLPLAMFFDIIGRGDVMVVRSRKGYSAVCVEYFDCGGLARTRFDVFAQMSS